MRTVHSLGLAAVILLLIFVPECVQSAETRSLRVARPRCRLRIKARSLQPGEIVLVSVTTAAPVAAVHGRAFGRDVWFAQSEDHAVWRGLVGIDLTTEPGDYAVALRVRMVEALTAESRYRLTVAPKTFDTRRLTVDPNYVNPPAEVLAGSSVSRGESRSSFAARARRDSGMDPSCARFPVRRPAASAGEVS